MISHIDIAHFGPHEHLSLDWPGGLTLRGQSGAGKTAVADAIAWCLYGTDRMGRTLTYEASVTHGHRGQTVALTLDSGTVLTRHRTASGTTRTITRGDETRTYSRESEWSDALLIVGERDLMLAIMMPMYWARLAGQSRGRPLRDVILRALERGGAETDISATIARLMEPHGGLRPGDPMAERDAKKSQRRANGDAARQEGIVAAREQEVTRLHEQRIIPPDERDIAAADAIMAAVEEWERYTRAEADRRRARAHLEGLRQRRDAWRQERERLLAARPAAHLDEAQAAVDSAAEEYERAAEQWRAALDEHHAWDARRRAYEQYVADHRRWSQLMAAYTASVGQRESTARARIKEGTGAQRLRLCYQGDGCPILHDYIHADIAPREPERVEPPGEEPDVEAARSIRDDAARHLRQAEDTLHAIEQWQRDIAAMGPEPEVLEVSASVQVDRPGVPRPTEAEVEQARAIIEQQRAAQLASETHASHIADAERRLRTARESLDVAQAEAERCQALVRAIREAPGVLARSLMQRLGDIAPLAIEMDDTGCTVTLDGRSIETLQSRGRLLVADLRLRLALRRLVGHWVPVVVDHVQDLAGEEWPSVAVPVCWLITAAGPLTIITPEGAS